MAMREAESKELYTLSWLFSMLPNAVGKARKAKAPLLGYMNTVSS